MSRKLGVHTQSHEMDVEFTQQPHRKSRLLMKTICFLPEEVGSFSAKIKEKNCFFKIFLERWLR